MLVPPMSKAMIFSNPARFPMAAAPTTPAAGPLSRLSFGRYPSRDTNPPALVITSNSPPDKASLTQSRYSVINGPRYASTTVVSARGTALIKGANWAEQATYPKPHFSNTSLTANSCEGFW